MTTFEEWLKQNKHRDDGIGEFARGALQAGAGPKRTAGYEEWIGHLAKLPNGYEAFDIFKQAWEQFALETGNLIRVQVISESREYGQFVEVEIYAASVTMARAAARALALNYDRSEISAVYVNNPLQRLDLA